MVGSDPETARIVGEIVGQATGGLGKEISRFTGWITNFINELSWFEWAIIIFIIGISILYVVLKRKVKELENSSRRSLYGRRNFKR